MKRSWVYAFIVALWGVTGAAPEAAGQMRVEAMAFSTRIQDKEPAGGNQIFTADSENVYCFTRVADADAPTSIYHVWYFQGQERFRIVLAVRHDAWRTWSSRATRRLISEGEGLWRVDVEANDGQVLMSREFVIRSTVEGG
jgi:hypothetical protein